MSIKISPKLQQVLNYDTTSFTKDELKKHGLSEAEIVLYYRLKSVQCALDYEEENKVILTEDGLKRFGLGEEERNLYHVIKKQQEKTNKKSLPKAMNKKQRAIIIGGIVAIIIMFLFPPYALYHVGGKYGKGYGYHVNYVLKPSDPTGTREVIDIGTLSIQYVTIIIIGSLLWILARDTKLKDNLKGDQEKTK
jgi:hypothetical protein